ncbi:hypothetical protein [Nitrosopumilus sp.]|uniref:hypothetical protein n=1 Tax=Nitrosopumilus sp. TaxID=2024843 RepID=UPI003B5C2196
MVKRNHIIIIAVIACFLSIFVIRKSFIDALWVTTFSGTLVAFGVVILHGAITSKEKKRKHIGKIVLSVIFFAGAVFSAIGVFTGIIQYDPNSSA